MSGRGYVKRLCITLGFLKDYTKKKWHLSQVGARNEGLGKASCGVTAFLGIGIELTNQTNRFSNLDCCQHRTSPVTLVQELTEVRAAKIHRRVDSTP